MEWLSFRGAQRLLDVLPGLGLDPEDLALVERRLFAPSLRRARKRDLRDEGVRRLAGVYLRSMPLTSGRELSRLMEIDCRRRPPPDDPRRPFVDQILANSLPSRPPTAETLRDALIGWQRRREPKFKREVVRPARLARR